MTSDSEIYSSHGHFHCRFSKFLLSKILKLCSRSKHTFAKSVLEEVDSYGIASISDRSKLLNKVSFCHYELDSAKKQNNNLWYFFLFNCSDFI